MNITVPVVSLHPNAQCGFGYYLIVSWSCISDSRDRRTTVHWHKPVRTGGCRLAPRHVGLLVSLCMRSSTADIRNLLLPWHYPSNCHAGLSSVYRSYPLLLPFCSSLFSALRRAEPTCVVVVVCVSLSSRRQSVSLFICRLQCNITPAAAYSNTYNTLMYRKPEAPRDSLFTDDHLFFFKL